MAIINFGSLNIDDVYAVDHIVQPGETLSATRYQVFPGGKGNNQSIALGRAGAAVRHVGCVGPDGAWLTDLLREAGVNADAVQTGTIPTGRAIIQVDAKGQNSIVLFPGANHHQSRGHFAAVLDSCQAGDTVLVQNETSEVPFVMTEAHRRGLRVVFNPAPMAPEVLAYPLDAVSLLVVNETEAAALCGQNGDAEKLSAALRSRWPTLDVILTLGGDGVLYRGKEGRIAVPGQRVDVVDTTAAGDTFIGYFLAAQQKGFDIRTALETANRAAAVTVTRPGAASSIPTWNEVISS
jgi:ribokinase